MDLRRHVPCAVMSFGAALAVWGSFRPWLRSGSAERSSYELLGVVDRLAGPTGALRWAVVAWPTMPLMIVTATAIVWWGRALLGGAVGIVAGLYAMLVAFGVRQAPGDGLVRPMAGPSITLLGSLVFVAGLVAAMALSAAASRSERVAAARAAAVGPRTADV